MGGWCGPEESDRVPWTWHSSRSQFPMLFQGDLVTGCSGAGLRSSGPFLLARSDPRWSAVLCNHCSMRNKTGRPARAVPLAGPGRQDRMEVKLTIAGGSQ